MKYSSLVLILLLFAVLSCSDENLIGVEAEDALSTAEAVVQPSTNVWPEASQAVSLDREKVNAALAGGDMVLQMGAVTFYPDPEVSAILPCLDAGGNPVPGVALPARFLVEGRVQHMGRVTGYFGGGSCQVNADFTLTINREWRYVGDEGHAIHGTYVATAFPDGSFTSRDLVTGGIGKFGGATGWGRSVGQNNPATGTGTVYSKGVVTAPKDVVAYGYVSASEGFTRSGDLISCVDPDGNPTGFRGTAQFEGTGLTTYGPVSVVVINERCIDVGDVSTFYGTSTLTGAQGDVLRMTHTTVVGVGDPWPNTLIITGGTGRFEGVTGWVNGLVYWDEGRSDEEGVIFFPR